MFSFALMGRYLLWHYTEALYDLITICRGLAMFWLDFWGVSYFTETLAEPLWDGSAGIFSDIFSRFSGLIIRFVFITIGTIGAIIMLPISLLVIVGWLIYPVFVLILIGLGLKFLIYG